MGGDTGARCIFCNEILVCSWDKLCSKQKCLNRAVEELATLKQELGEARELLAEVNEHWSKRKWNWKDEFTWTIIYKNIKAFLEAKSTEGKESKP